VFASFLTRTCVLGALVVVAAEVHQVASHLRRFVREAITIVIDSVTRLRGGDRGIAVAQSFLAANPLARADTKVVG